MSDFRALILPGFNIDLDGDLSVLNTDLIQYPLKQFIQYFIAFLILNHLVVISCL